MRRAGATLHRGARASHCRGLSRCGAQAPDAQAQQLWLTGPVAPRHVGSSQTRARTRVPRIGRRILNHCATREAPKFFLKAASFHLVLKTTVAHPGPSDAPPMVWPYYFRPTETRISPTFLLFTLFSPLLVCIHHVHSSWL